MTFSYEKEMPTVGEAVQSILASDQKSPEVGEIISEYGDSYVSQIQECIDRNYKGYESPFFIVVLHKKEFWATNVVRNWFMARQTEPTMESMWTNFPNFMHTVYQVDKEKSQVKLLWTLPSPQEAQVILNNPSLYDVQLCNWCLQAAKKFLSI